MSDPVTPLNTSTPDDLVAACPFCGDYGAEEAKSSVPDMRGGWKRVVYCNTCFGEGPPADDSAAAIKAWNHRASLFAHAGEPTAQPHASAQEAAQEGWKLVPVEPDGRMWSAGRAEFVRHAQSCEDAWSADKASVIGDVAGSEIYRAMLRAAPHAPAPVQAAPTEHRIWCDASTSADAKCSCHAPPAPVAADTLKDHEIAQLVNTLRDIAVEFHATQQLRDRISRAVLAALASPARAAEPQEQADAAERYWTQPGESVMGIALRQLKDESRWKEIRDLNASSFPDMRPHDYYPVGTALKMPARKAQGEKP